MGDIDFTGASILKEVVSDLQARKIELAIARAGTEVMANLKQSGILAQIGDSRIYETVDEAVRALAPPVGGTA
jgi:MFS superfamily sulfate permease-like transporter